MNKYIIPLLSGLFIMACNSKQESANLHNIAYHISPATSSSAEPYLFTDNEGSTYLSWLQKKEKGVEFKFSKWNGDGWSSPILIDSGSSWFVNWADYPMIAKNNSAFISHYLEKSGEGTYSYDVKIKVSADEGKTWSPSKVLHDDGKQAEHGFVSMIPYGQNFLIAWLDGRNAAMEETENHNEHGHHGQMSLRAAILDKEGNKINEWELDNRTCDCCQTSATITDSGPVVVYRDRSEKEVRDISIVRLVDGKWTAPHPVYNDNWKIEGCPVNGPRVSANGSTLVVAWFTITDHKSKVTVSFSDDGGKTFDKPIRVDEGKAIGRVDVVMLDRESAMVSWMEGVKIKSAKVNRDGSKERSIVIGESSESRSSGFPQMTRHGNQILFAWTDDKEKNIKFASLPLTRDDK
jgi:hypothetical protein